MCEVFKFVCVSFTLISVKELNECECNFLKEQRLELDNEHGKRIQRSDMFVGVTGLQLMIISINLPMDFSINRLVYKCQKIVQNAPEPNLMLCFLAKQYEKQSDLLLGK